MVILRDALDRAEQYHERELVAAAIPGPSDATTSEGRKRPLEDAEVERRPKRRKVEASSDEAEPESLVSPAVKV